MHPLTAATADVTPNAERVTLKFSDWRSAFLKEKDGPTARPEWR
jgi:hypothetical protein